LEIKDKLHTLQHAILTRSTYEVGATGRSYLAVPLHISSPESVFGWWCVCVWGGGRGLEKRHHRWLYAPTQTYSIETVQQNKYLQTTVKVQNYIHEGGERRTESTSA
jgi:hypothetical protein